MKKLFMTIALIFSLAITAEAAIDSTHFLDNIKRKRSSGSVTRVSQSGGWNGRANGIEGRSVTFGFHLGGAIPLIDAQKTEAALFGGKADFHVYALIPRTKTFTIGGNISACYLLTSQNKYEENLISTSRDRSTAEDLKPQASVDNWLLATAQVAFMGNFHPKQRFNIQLKCNLGVVMAMIPQYEATYYQKDIQLDGTYREMKYTYAYKSDMSLGFCGTLGTDLLYALGNHSEVKFGVDFSYMRFSYTKEWTLPTEKNTKHISQFGLLDLHVGFAFNF